jgi:hypothetical protein
MKWGIAAVGFFLGFACGVRVGWCYLHNQLSLHQRRWVDDGMVNLDKDRLGP